MTMPMRISFLLAREDNARLYDELAQFPKGQRRVNRLRTLAYDGLLTQQGAAVPVVAGTDRLPTTACIPGVSAERTEAALELFSDPIAE
ncbi:hypothetical protein [Massilia sp. YMA4]|uniref:Uncharacterized protein n=1 Tax=[Empedobacter] haloabium TaxID=592317 RepID=A0ABZ1URI4_9BURK|nr:hypothetical protein [Massilia sp. YMA4]AXA91355.1 hypothetical protein DPH57_09440 [Massilia sp. YMA4]